MILKNEQYTIEIIKIETPLPDDFQVSQHDLVFDPENRLSTEEDSVFDITINSHQHTQRAALVGFFSCVYDEHPAVLEGNSIVVLQEFTLTRIDLQSLRVTKHQIIDDYGMLFEIHKYQDSYVIYGETDILRVNSDFEVVWSFSGEDIFVTADEKVCFEMTADRIKLRDWNNNYYEIDYEGKEVVFTRQSQSR